MVNRLILRLFKALKLRSGRCVGDGLMTSLAALNRLKSTKFCCLGCVAFEVRVPWFGRCYYDLLRSKSVVIGNGSVVLEEDFTKSLTVGMYGRVKCLTHKILLLSEQFGMKWSGYFY